jgi:hypothetical protein
MREAAIEAGLVQSARAGDINWRDRLKIITEPEAAAVHCAHLTDLHRLRPSQNFVVCDAGGGTVDLAVYKVKVPSKTESMVLTIFQIIGQTTDLEIAEIAARSGANCGSLFLDLRFRELVKTVRRLVPSISPSSNCLSCWRITLHTWIPLPWPISVSNYIRKDSRVLTSK